MGIYNLWITDFGLCKPITAEIIMSEFLTGYEFIMYDLVGHISQG